MYINESLVITTDTGEKNVVRRISSSASDESKFFYYDVITGSYYSDHEVGSVLLKGKVRYPIYLNITDIESIIDYLTTEKISKLMQNELSVEDCAEIMSRIKGSAKEEGKTKN